MSVIKGLLNQYPDSFITCEAHLEGKDVQFYSSQHSRNNCYQAALRLHNTDVLFTKIFPSLVVLRDFLIRIVNIDFINIDEIQIRHIKLDNSNYLYENCISINSLNRLKLINKKALSKNTMNDIQIGNSGEKLIEATLDRTRKRYLLVISEMIHNHIDKHNMTKEQLEGILKLSPNKVDSYLSGTYNFNVKELVDIQHFLKIDILSLDVATTYKKLFKDVSFL